MIINAKFITSATDISNALNSSLSEVVFLGRSNVGKSSLINSLCNRKNLAKSSSTPGKTKLINFFEVEFKGDDENFKANFIDLPGFGYAKVSKSMQDDWQKKIDNFLRKRINLRLFIHLIDSRQFDLEIDKNLQKYLNEFIRGDQKILKVFTKSDKLNQSERSKVLQLHKDAFFVSSLKKNGIKELDELIFKQILGK